MIVAILEKFKYHGSRIMHTLKYSAQHIQNYIVS